MINKTSLTIDEDLLAALAQSVPGEKTPLSLLSTNQNDVGTDKMSRLRTAGVTTDSDRVRPEYIQMLDTIAKTRNVASLKYTAGSRLYEFVTSFPEASDKQSVSVLRDANKLIIESPSAVEDAFTLIDQNIGHSRLASSNFSERLTVEEALDVFALMDLVRSSILRAIADETDLKTLTFDLQAITKKALNQKETIQSLTYVLKSKLKLSAPPTTNQIKAGLKSLVNKKMVTQENDKYKLNDALNHFAGRLTVIDNLVSVDAGRFTDDNRLLNANFTALQSGVNDILYFENHINEIVVKSIPAMALVGLVAKFLNEPDAIKLASPLKTNPTTTESATTKKYCQQCGAPLGIVAKFCERCGTKTGN